MSIKIDHCNADDHDANDDIIVSVTLYVASVVKTIISLKL